MDKIAAIKQAEVQGVLAALVDAEMVKVANEEVFLKLAEVVSENLSEDYNLEDVIQKTAEVIEAANAPEQLEKEAEELDEIGQALLSHHELVLRKQAGQVSDEDFRKEASKIRSAIGGVSKAIKAPFDSTSTLRDSLSKRLQEAKTNWKKDPSAPIIDKAKTKEMNKTIATEVAKTVGAYGAAAAAAYGGKKGVDKARGK